MSKSLKWALVVLSIILAVLIVRSDVVHYLSALDGFERILSLIAGIFFTSVFTTAPAIAVLAELMKELPTWQVAVFGGLGAVFGDFIIFHMIQSTVHREVAVLRAIPRIERYKKIFDTKLFHRFLWFLGAIILASPLPDELALALMGASEIKTSQFLITSFVFNTIGIGLLASAIASATL